MVTSTHESHVKIWLVPTRYLRVLIDNELDQNNSDPFDSLLMSNESEQNM